MTVKFSNFSRHNATAGNTTIIVLVLTAAALVGISKMMDSSVMMRQHLADQDLKNQQKDNPRSSTLMAKALVSRPAAVESSLSTFWISDGIRDHQERLPVVYPSPYIGGYNAGKALTDPPAPATSSTTFATTVRDFAGRPFDASAIGTTGVVKILTHDSGRSPSTSFDVVLQNPNFAVFNADFPDKLKRSESRVTYQLKNCDIFGKPSTEFTAYYCVNATIESDTYTRSADGSMTKSTGVNRATASLGLLPPPPPPVCTSVTSNLLNTITAGAPLDITIQASGVAVGYKIKLFADGNHIGSIDSGNGKKALAWNKLNSTTDATQTIRFDTSSISSKMFNGAIITAAATLTAIDGSPAVCPTTGSNSIRLTSSSPAKPTCELRPVQAHKNFYGCYREGRASGLVVKITGGVPVTANPVVTKFQGSTTSIPTATWTTTSSWNIWNQYPCTDATATAPCFWGPFFDKDVLLPGEYEVRVTGTNGSTNTCSAFLYGGYDTGYRCNMSYSENQVAETARSKASDLGISMPAGPSTVAFDLPTHEKLCSMVGKKVGYRDVYGSELRAGYSTCGNNSHIVWSPLQGQFIAGWACYYYWTGSLVCN